MGYVQENLVPGERVILRATPHWASFIMPAVPFVFGVVLIGFSLGSERGSLFACMGLVFLVVALVQVVSVGVVFFTTEFALTDRRIIAKSGFLRRRSLELLLTKVESIQVNQPLLGRVLDYGTVVVVGTGGTQQPFRYISNPHELRKHVNARLAGAS